MKNWQVDIYFVILTLNINNDFIKWDLHLIRKITRTDIYFKISR